MEKEKLAELQNLIQVWQYDETKRDNIDEEKNLQMKIQDFVNMNKESPEFKTFKIYFTNGWEEELHSFDPEKRSKWIGNITSKLDERLLQVYIGICNAGLNGTYYRLRCNVQQAQIHPAELFTHNQNYLHSH